MILSCNEDRAMRARRLIAVAAAAAFAALAVGVFVRGAWAAPVPAEPPSVDDGPVACVVQGPDGGKEVCAAVRLPYALEEVWEAVTDYDHYGDICSFIHSAEVDRGPDGCKVAATANTLLGGRVPFTFELKHERELFEYRSTWDQASGDVLVNRGGWVVRPAGERETLLLLRLEVQVRGVPTFLLRNLSRHRLCAVLRAVRTRLRDGPSDKSW
jgi:hypothetical protein